MDELYIHYIVGSKSVAPLPLGPKQGLTFFKVSYAHIKEIKLTAPQIFFSEGREM